MSEENRTRLIFPPVLCAVLATIWLLATPAAGGDNPAAEGFDVAGSDPEAIQIADEVMQAMGGREAWDATRYVTWNFFDRRRHLWDKHTGDIRVEGITRDSEKAFVVLMNIHTGSGRAWLEGEEVTDPEVLAEMLDYGEAVWINDGYWMFMPYKLKDSGVTLSYVGEGTMLDGSGAHVLQLTFEGVGRTPENKYLVYVGLDSGLVEQWDFFAEATDAEPRFQNPWSNWQRYGRILLSDSRGDGGHTDIAVFSEVRPTIFTDPAPVDWPALLALGERPR
jgi:hypothetical protein